VNISSKVIIPENYTLDTALTTNSQLSHSILALRTNLAPIIKGNNKVFFTKLYNVYLHCQILLL